jgi:hypothetical protein
MGRSLSLLGLLAVAVGVAALVSNLRAAAATPPAPPPGPPTPPAVDHLAALQVRAFSTRLSRSTERRAA